MTKGEVQEINETTYQRCVSAFSLIHERLGINIKVHDAQDQFEQGQIFLFNHFARFETVIPQYLIYQATGAYCRCVAAAELFEANDKFSKFLWSVGAVPHNHPGLLAFLAAEILKGRKIIIFPEGGMIKDRRVMAPTGEFEIYSPTADKTRKHHKGAAAIALTLEIFKKRILSVFENDDSERLQRWAKALNFSNTYDLVAAAQKPTFIVPGNITFYPIHWEENLLVKVAGLMGEDMSERAREELLIEGNLLLRKTDMDIRLGTPIEPEISWSFWERALLKKAFSHIDSLNELFALKDDSDQWMDRIIAAAMSREIARLRDVSTREIYRNVTISISHVAAKLILTLLDHGQTEIPRASFHKYLYLAIRKIQERPEVKLHRSLTNPENYDGIHKGVCNGFEQFLDMATSLGLLEATLAQYRFLPKLTEDYAVHTVRLENPVLVYANEITPVDEACQAIEQAIVEAPSVDRAAFSDLLFEDETRRFHWNKKNHQKPRYAEVNDKETATESGAPFLLLPEPEKLNPEGVGIVLVHGFLASPAEVRPFGKELAEQGYPVVGIRLAGHGTSPWDLRNRSWSDWMQSVRRGYEIMSGYCRHICVIGFSTGGALALHLAAENPKGLAGVSAICAPLKFRNRQLVFVPLIHGLNVLTEWAWSWEGVMPFHLNDSEHPEINYRHIPVRGLFELRRVTDSLVGKLGDITCPVQVIQATDEHVVHPDSATLIHARLTTTEKSIHMVKSNRHGILLEDIGETREIILQFLEQQRQRYRISGALRPVSHHFPEPEPMRKRGIFRPLISKVKGLLAPPAAKKTVPEPVKQKRPYPWEAHYPKGLHWEIPITSKPLTDMFDDAVERFGDRPCTNFRGRHYTYSDIGNLVTRTAAGLQSLGVHKGVKVGLMLPNCPYSIILFYATLKAGGTVVNINPLYAAREIDHVVRDADIRFLATLNTQSLYKKAQEVAVNDAPIRKLIVCPIGGVMRFTEKILFDLMKSKEVAAIPKDDLHIPFTNLTHSKAAFSPTVIDAEKDIAVMQFTGGTTGIPKAAMLTHANLYANVMQVSHWSPGLKAGEEKILGVLPLFHAFGMTAVMNLGIEIGAELILTPLFKTQEILKLIDQEKPTAFVGVPTMFSAINTAKDLDKYDLTSLKFCISGGAPLPQAVQQEFEERSGCVLVEGYGLSETSPVCTVNPLDGTGKAGSVGLPLPNTVIEIVALDDPDRLVDIGEKGEVCIKGPQVMAGYATLEKENATAMRGGRLHTGDVGYMDKDGYLYIVDRIKELILSGGFNVYPRQVEEVIHLHPAVAEAAVCGIPDQHRGEIIKAFVVLKDNELPMSSNELRAFLKDKLAPFQMPRRIEFLHELPKTLIGKISKKDLCAQENAKAVKREQAASRQPHPQTGDDVPTS
ncbi:alpha/beta fold hydrolase [Aestuariispira ectoiniformans]|uniref:alpha/beta fold hydrolase n=1 Tax=Aestuariispira ectoiniformans TaxID=2775080 RepID=UPI00223AA5A0|nr:alpha/beta fold hydrolase [Aestuariispira ectoiniformans]